MADTPDVDLKIFLGMPHGSNQINVGAARAFFGRPTDRFDTEAWNVQSWGVCAFNTLWTDALNRMETAGVTHFGMLHGDVHPQDFWLDILMDELNRTGADVISVVAPMKCQGGVTSTAIGRDGDKWSPLRKLTMHEVYQLPETFDAADAGHPDHPLLINTGCLLVDLRRPWCRRTDSNGVARVCFRFDNEIRFIAGKWTARAESEDWHFSRTLFELGCKVLATRKVKLRHYGSVAFTNEQPWGEWKTDPVFAAEQNGGKSSVGSMPAPVFGI